MEVPDDRRRRRRAIDELRIQPVAKKGVCSYYSRDAVKKIKGALK